MTLAKSVLANWSHMPKNTSGHWGQLTEQPTPAVRNSSCLLLCKIVNTKRHPGGSLSFPLWTEPAAQSPISCCVHWTQIAGFKAGKKKKTTKNTLLSLQPRELKQTLGEVWTKTAIVCCCSVATACFLKTGLENFISANLSFSPMWWLLFKVKWLPHYT